MGSFPFLPEKRRISARAENTVPGLKNGIGAENEPFPFRAAGLKPGEIPRRVGFDGLPTIRAQTRLGAACGMNAGISGARSENRWYSEE